MKKIIMLCMVAIITGCAGNNLLGQPAVNERIDSFTGAKEITTDFAIVYDGENGDSMYLTSFKVSYHYSTSLSDKKAFAIDILVSDIVNIESVAINVDGKITSLRAVEPLTNYLANQSARRFMIYRSLMDKMLSSKNVKLRVKTLSYKTYDGNFNLQNFDFDAKASMIKFLDKVDSI